MNIFRLAKHLSTTEKLHPAVQSKERRKNFPCGGFHSSLSFSPLSFLAPCDSDSLDTFDSTNPSSKMKFIQTDQILAVPEGVSIDIKSRIITVSGPRGSLTKNLRHIDVAFSKPSENEIKITVHHGDRKHVAALRTVKSLIANLITGVTKGYKYKMRYVYAHFPINVNIINDGTTVEIRNFLGEKRVREINVAKGVNLEISANQKDELVLSGISLEDVSQSAADIQQATRVRNKDIRKFLDGIYVSEKGTIEQDA